MFLTDMVFEEDTTLLSFFDRYSEENDYEDLQESIKKYCGATTEASKPLEEQNTTGDSIEMVSALSCLRIYKKSVTNIQYSHFYTD